MQNFYSTKDMLRRSIQTPTTPQRIICLVPSLTELLYDLGLGDRVVGITKFCIHPETWYQSKTRVGGTKTINIEIIKSLQPDLIIANKEENAKEDIEFLMQQYTVWISDINTYSEALIAIENIGRLCNKELESKQLIQKIEKEKKAYSLNLINPKKILYLIWKGPYMAVGKSTYIDDILRLLGYSNCFLETRYKEISLEQIKALDPDYIFLSSEPYPFKESHIKELEKDIPNSVCKLVDGELFSWYGSRLLYTFKNSIFI